MCPTKAHSPPSRTSRAIRQSNISTVTCLAAQPCHGQQALSCPKTPKTRIFHKSPSASHDCRSHASIACLFEACSSFTPSEKTNHQSCAQPKIIEFFYWKKCHFCLLCNIILMMFMMNRRGRHRCYRGLLFTTPSY